MCSIISSNNITLNNDFDISYHGGESSSSSSSGDGGVISCSNKNENVIVGIDNNNNINSNDMNPRTTDMYNNSSINNNNNNTMVLLLPLIISYCSCSWISIALSYYSLTQVTITSLSNHRLDFLIFNYMKQIDKIINNSSTIIMKDDDTGNKINCCKQYHHRDKNIADNNYNHYDDDDDDDDRDLEKYKNISILTPEGMRKMEYLLGIYEPTIAKMPSLSIGNDVNVVFDSLNEYQVI